MDLQVLLFCLYGGIVSADTEAAWQVMISQPLVACTVAGFLLGNVDVGIMVGLLLQLPFLIEIPAGTAKVSQGNLGAYVAAGIAALLGLESPEISVVVTAVSIVLGLLLSRVALIFVKGIRNSSRFLVLKAEGNLERGRENITMYQILGVLIHFVFGIFFSAFFLIIGKYMVITLAQNITVPFQINYELLKPILLGAGVAVMLRMHVRKKTVGYSVLGAVSAAILFLISG